jgi:hypothetical protein
MSAQKQTLQGLVEQSFLLRNGQRQKLLKALPTLTPEQQSRLTEILNTEPVVLKKATEFTIQSASERNDKTFFAGLDAFFAEAAGRFAKAEEPFDKVDESEQLDHFFDAA